MPLLSLPFELLVRIFKYLDVQTAYACQRVDRLFNRVFQDSVELAYALECQIAGVDDNPYCTLPISTRLQMLRNREAAWTSLSPRHIVSGCVPQPAFPMFDMTCGLFVIGLADATRTIQDVGGGIQTCPIPIAGEDAPDESSWSIFRMNGMIDFATCLPEHDLLAFLVIEKLAEDMFEIRISLISHSLNSPHPLAQKPMFPVCQVRSPEGVYTSMNIAGENLVLSVEIGDNGGLYFFNWQTGELKVPPLQDIEYTDLVFLRHDLVLHPSNRHRCLDIFYVPPSAEGGEVKLIQNFYLPLAYPHDVFTVEVRGSPNVTTNNSFPRYVPSRLPFVDRPQDAIILFTFHRQRGQAPISFVIHRETLIKALPPQSEWSKMGPPQLSTWETWGLNASRWIGNDSAVELFTTLPFGQRCLHIGPTLTLLDFNRYQSRKDSHESDVERLKPPIDGAEGHLPYALHSSPLLPFDQGASGVFLSGSGIVALKWTYEASHYFTISYQTLHFG